MGDLEEDPESLTVEIEAAAAALLRTAATGATSNGITLSNVNVQADGDVLADVEATCMATTGYFILRVTDSGGQSAETNLAIAVTPEAIPSVPTVATTVSSLWPANNKLVDVGLSGSASDNCDPEPGLRVDAFSNEDDGSGSPDAAGVNGALLLRAERQGGGDGRVYLIVLTATDYAGNTSIAATAVVVPKANAAKWKDLAATMAQDAVAFALSHGGAPPPGYAVVGD